MSARKAKRSHRSPRRKAGSSTRSRKKRKVTFRLVVEEQAMLVSYEPNWLGSEFAHGHFEFRSPHKPARRILVSETGYFSHFAPMAKINASPSPEDYARSVVLAILGRAPDQAPSKGKGIQLSLF